MSENIFELPARQEDHTGPRHVDPADFARFERYAAEIFEAIAATGRNPRYLPDVDLSDIRAVALPELPDADVLVMAVPSHAFGEVATSLPDGPPVLSLAKGLYPATGNRLSTLLAGHRVAVLSGPNFASEIASGLPALAVIASEDEELATWLQHEINSQIFRV